MKIHPHFPQLDLDNERAAAAATRACMATLPSSDRRAFALKLNRYYEEALQELPPQLVVSAAAILAGFAAGGRAGGGATEASARGGGRAGGLDQAQRPTDLAVLS